MKLLLLIICIYKAIIKSFVKLVNQDMFHACPLCGSVEPSIYAKLPMLSFFSLIYRTINAGRERVQYISNIILTAMLSIPYTVMLFY